MVNQAVKFFIEEVFGKGTLSPQCYSSKVMDVLGYLIKKAADVGLLEPLTENSVHNHISLYADDVIFLHPVALDLEITMDNSQDFW
jgi:hypothetical protein